MNQNCLILTNNVLYAPDFDLTKDSEQKVLADRFCGTVVQSISDLANLHCKRQCMVYLTGQFNNDTQAMVQENVAKDDREVSDIVDSNVTFCIVKEFSSQYEELLAKAHKNVKLVAKGAMPINVYNVGVMFPNFFDQNIDYFKSIKSEHQFQELTESNKDGVALRKGIYLSNVRHFVEPDGSDKGALSFNLLRCSSNLRGPTDNFRKTDHSILAQANEVIPKFYERPAQLNHVLAQIYYNRRDDKTAKETKASIKCHSDKTKDMPVNGMIAFATFYNFGTLSPKVSVTKDPFDLCYQSKKRAKPSGSMLTELEFVLKNPEKHPYLHSKFRVKLYPNSLFVISLTTNRLYTHEIKPPVLPVDKIPTRLGYVMRCSKTRAIFREGSSGGSDGQTYIVGKTESLGEINMDNENKKVERALEKASPEEVAIIKDLYFRENTSDEPVVYPKIYSSLNEGDYKRPTL